MLKSVITSAFFILFISSLTFSQPSLNKLSAKSDFEKLAGLPLSEKYGQVSAIKIVYDLKTDKLHFINAKYYKYHHEFCRFFINHDVELEYFNSVNYSNDPERRFWLANINYYKSIDIYALEISPVDQMSVEEIIQLYNLTSRNIFIGDSLRFLLNSSRLQEKSDEIGSEIPVLNPAAIYKNLQYQAIGKYKNCGVLHFITNLTEEKKKISPMDIVVLNETPLYMPKVAGVIVSEFQTPLSHLTILGQNRKIPIAAYKKAFYDSSLIRLNKQKICLEVKGDSFLVERKNELITNNNTQKQIKLKFNLEADSIISLKYLNKKSFKYAGNKASNFAILNKLSQKADFKVPECAFVIPFYFYHKHVQSSQASILIETLLTTKEKITDQDSLRLFLKNIRKEIKKAPIDKELLIAINNKVRAEGNYQRFRFRSSTNAEDAKGFSGAGLYTSKTGILNNEKKSFEKAIKKVWASLWSYEAFSEREYYHIKHRNVFMGILVHRGFPSEEVNGVAITKNLYRSETFGFVINAQLGDESVVKPTSGNISDQFLCYPNNSDNIYKNKNTVDIITQSNLNNNKLVMSDSEIQKLANQLELVKHYYYNHTLTTKSFLEFGLDIEFKLDGKTRELYIKQVRLYND